MRRSRLRSSDLPEAPVDRAVTVVLWSFALAVLGLAASRWGASVLARRAPPATPRAQWLAGLPALLPAWLLPFVSLLNAVGTAEGPPRKAFMVASAAAILGVLGSDWLINREERRPPRGAPPPVVAHRRRRARASVAGGAPSRDEPGPLSFPSAVLG